MENNITPAQEAEIVPVWNLKEAIKLRKTGLTYKDIAKHFDKTVVFVRRNLDEYNIPIDDAAVEIYQANKASILDAAQARVLKSITNFDLMSATLQQKATAFGILYDKSRLERNQSTNNIGLGISHIIERIEGSEKK